MLTMKNPTIVMPMVMRNYDRAERLGSSYLNRSFPPAALLLMTKNQRFVCSWQ